MNRPDRLPQHPHGQRRLQPAALLVLLIVATAAALLPQSASAAITVHIEGLSGALLANVRALLEIEQSKKEPGISDLRVHLLHERAPDNIRQALRPFGYYRPAIESELQRTSQGWVASYRVQVGPPLRIATLDVRVAGAAASDPAFTQAIAKLPLRRGQRLIDQDYDEAKNRLRRLAAERGYFDARFTVHEVAVDLVAYQATVRLHFDSGPRYRFGPTRFDQKVFSDKFLQKFVPYRAGSPFLSSRLMDLQSGLLDSDYFSDVRVVRHPERAIDLKVPIDVELTPVRPQRYTFGIGYGTDTGARASVSWELRRINPQGHRFKTELSFSEIGHSLSAAYTIPIFDPRTDRLAFTASQSEQDTDTSISRLTKAGAAIEQARAAWHQTLSLNFQRETSRVAGVIQHTDLIMPGVQWQRIWAKNPLNVRSGHRLAIDIHGGSETLGSDISFLQVRVQGKDIFTLWDGGRFIGRWDVGHTEVAKTQELPASQRFFAGGDQSIRGYAYQSLGPTDASGQVVGGRNLAVASIELDQHVTGPWSAAVFYDAGHAYDNPSEPVYHGAGFGLRWRSPVGPIRLDFARALDRKGEPWRVHLIIGPDL